MLGKPIPERIIVFGAHFDDAFLGAGGWSAKLATNNHHITFVVFAGNGDHPYLLQDRNSQFEHACKVLGIHDTLTYNLPLHKLSEHGYEMRELMGELQRKIHPELILVPSLNDTHQDHTAVAWEGIRTFRSHETILGYELPRHGSIFFQPNVFVDVTAYIQKKIDALMCYKTELERHPNYFNPEVFKSIARMHGNQVGIKYAEAYEAIKFYI